MDLSTITTAGSSLDAAAASVVVVVAVVVDWSSLSSVCFPLLLAAVDVIMSPMSHLPVWTQRRANSKALVGGGGAASFTY